MTVAAKHLRARRSQSVSDGWKRRQEQRRAEIIRAAATLFFDKGYGRTSMDDVICAVGGSKRTLYAHFSRKEDLFAAIVTKVSGDALDFEIEVKADLAASLRNFGERYLAALLSEEALRLYRAIVSEARYFPELARAFFDNGPKRITDRLMELFAVHERAGHGTLGEPRQTALLFVGMLRADHHLAAVLTDKTMTAMQIKRYVSNAVNTLLHGAVAESQERSHERIADR